MTVDNNILIRPRLANNVIQLKPEKKVFAPGIYDIPNDDYHASEGMSRSALTLFKRSPLHYANRYIYGEQEEDTKALLIGRAVNTYILEPHKFVDQFYVEEKVDGRTKEGKERRKEMQEEAKGRVILPADIFQEVEQIGRSFLEHETAPLFLKSALIERSIFWQDPYTEMLLKCRPDIWKSNIVADLKTSYDASERSFQRDMLEYGYHIQAALILDGIYHATGKKIETFAFVVIEKKSPFAIAIYEIDQLAIDKGRQEYVDLLVEFRDHQERQCWTGYKTKTISLPAYYY